MNRKNNKLLTLMLAGMLCTATVGAVAATSSVDASAATSAKTYALSTVFETSASSTSKVKGNEDGKSVLTLANGGSIALKNNLAIKWFSAKDPPEYMSLAVTFADVKFPARACFDRVPFGQSSRSRRLQPAQIRNFC